MMKLLMRFLACAKSTTARYHSPHLFRDKCKSLPSAVQHVTSRSMCDVAPVDDAVESHLYDEMSNEFLGVIAGGHRVLIIQPYIKWGPDKKTITTPHLQLQEAEALVKTLPYWTVVHKMLAPLLTFKRKYILGSGSLENVKELLAKDRSITAVFFGLQTMKYIQAKSLKSELGVEVFDRYSLIVHIFRVHAKTPEAKLQVALAEIPYVRRKVNSLSEGNMGMINLMEHRKKILESRELKLKKKLGKLKEHRQLIRLNRRSNEIPAIAVIGYTNAGKTSLIKALTGDVSLKPRNELFATLDTTVHEGMLPCRMKVLFVDTIGFIQDVPEMLIEPFKATLEDALIADILIHVYDASHPDRVAQVQHVENTIQSLYKDSSPPVIINVANKCDLLEDGEAVPETDFPIVATDLTGIDLLRNRIQNAILTSTGRTVLKIRVRTGSPAESWLYKEMTVIHSDPDETDTQHALLHVVTTEVQMFRFKRYLRQNSGRNI